MTGPCVHRLRQPCLSTRAGLPGGALLRDFHAHAPALAAGTVVAACGLRAPCTTARIPCPRARADLPIPCIGADLKALAPPRSSTAAPQRGTPDPVCPSHAGAPARTSDPCAASTPTPSAKPQPRAPLLLLCLCTGAALQACTATQSPRPCRSAKPGPRAPLRGSHIPRTGRRTSVPEPPRNFHGRAPARTSGPCAGADSGARALARTPGLFAGAVLPGPRAPARYYPGPVRRRGTPRTPCAGAGLPGLVR